VCIHLSDGSFFVLQAEVFLRAGLSAGSALAVEARDALLASSDRVRARMRALALIARAAQTRRGLSRKLAARGFSPDAVRHAVARMAELGYLDDAAFADSWLRSRIGARPEGAHALYRGLLGRGVDRAAASEALERLFPPEVELEAARALAAGRPPNAAIRALTGRGFRSRTIAAVIRELRGPRGTDPRAPGA
jgi:regulatory protein